MAARIAEREERLKELDKLKSEFVSGVSHEPRAPLIELALRGSPPGFDFARAESVDTSRGAK